MAAQRHGGSDEEKAKLILENIELKKKFTTERDARLVAEERAQDVERENTSLKEELSRTKDALENEIRQHRLLQGLFSGSPQGGEELENAHGMIQSLREDKQALIASVESKESANVDLRQAVRDLERDVRNMKTELETSSKSERIAKLRVEELKRKCDNFYEQVSGLISQIQESELETSSLRQEISWLRQEVIRLRDEIDILLVTRESLPFL